jgi:hypothetical protein
MDLSLGIWKPSELEVQNERDVLIHSEYHNPIERFPEKMDQLLEALNRVCSHFLMMKNQTRFIFTVQIYMDQQVGTPKQKIMTVSMLPTHRRRRIQQA